MSAPLLKLKTSVIFFNTIIDESEKVNAIRKNPSCAKMATVLRLFQLQNYDIPQHAKGQNRLPYLSRAMVLFYS